MAETTETVDIEVTSEELFRQAVADKPVKPPEETPPPHPDDENRDIHGRYRRTAEEQAPKPPGEPPPTPTPQPPTPTPTPVPPGTPTPQPPPGTPPPPQAEDANVPAWRLRELRERRDAAEHRAQQSEMLLRQMQDRLQQYERPQQPQELPDPLIDPQGYRSAMENKFQSDLRTIQLENNLQLNRLQHGETFDHAYQAFMQAAQGDPGFARLIVNSPNPGAAMVNWYRRATVLSQVGDDPQKYVEQEIMRRLSDPQFLGRVVEAARNYASGQQQQPVVSGRPNNVTQIPPSLARVPSGSPTEVMQPGGSFDNEDLFRKSLPPQRKRS
jgi:hypothetical protein